eukprot:5207994-Pleurochrysis_carterae.AAC.1
MSSGRSFAAAAQHGSIGSQKIMWLAPRKMQRSTSAAPEANASSTVRRSVSVASDEAERDAEMPS